VSKADIGVSKVKTGVSKADVGVSEADIGVFKVETGVPVSKVYVTAKNTDETATNAQLVAESLGIQTRRVLKVEREKLNPILFNTVFTGNRGNKQFFHKFDSKDLLNFKKKNAHRANTWHSRFSDTMIKRYVRVYPNKL